MMTSYLQSLQEFIIYLENISYFHLVTENGVVWIVNIFTFWMSLKILMKIFGGYDSEFTEEYVGGNKQIVREHMETFEKVKSFYK